MLDDLLDRASAVRDSTVLFAIALLSVVVAVAFFAYLNPAFAIVPTVLAVGAAAIGARRRLDGY